MKANDLARKKRKKLLVDTSAIRPAMAKVPALQAEAFTERVGDSDLYASVYVRMESIRRFVRSQIRVAMRIKQFDSVSDALFHLEQDFSIRDVKATIAATALFMRNRGAMSSPADAAEEMGRIAVHWLLEFDELFSSQINNSSQCSIGGKQLDVDFNTLLSDLHAFYEDFSVVVEDCPVSTFLEKSKRLKLVLETDSCESLDVVEAYRDLRSKGSVINCKACAKLGDLVISLEVPQSMGIAHVDDSFDALCDSQGITSCKIPSERSLYSEPNLARTGVPEISQDDTIPETSTE